MKFKVYSGTEDVTDDVLISGNGDVYMITESWTKNVWCGDIGMVKKIRTVECEKLDDTDAMELMLVQEGEQNG